MKKLFILIACLTLLIGTLAACGSSDGNTGTLVSTTTPVPTATPTPVKHFTVGQTVNVGDTWQVTINSVKISNGDGFIKPKTGNTFLIVDLTLKNVSSQEDSISSVLNFSIKDGTGQKYEDIYLDGNTAPDGKVAAGDNLRGQLVYEVPMSQHKFTFAFEPDIISTGQTIWDISI